jgi:Glutaminase
MPQPPIVDVVEEAPAPVAMGPLGAGEPRAVRLRGEGIVYLEPDNTAYERVVRTFRALERPLYFTLKEGTRLVDSLAIPITTRVIGLSAEAGGGMRVRLDGSAKRHVLFPTADGYADMVDLLAEAARTRTFVLVTRRPEATAILDVRTTPQPPAQPKTLVGSIVIGRPAIRTISTVTSAVARAVFQRVRAESCALPSPQAGCIPFAHPFDGCWVRANRMCEIIAREFQEVPAKLWVYGDLLVKTSNSPTCEVNWDWHVAPVLFERSSRSRRMIVIDPSVGPGPLPRAEWQALLGDPTVQTVVTGPSVFNQAEPGVLELAGPDDTAQGLEVYLCALLLQACQHGAPPYRCVT